MDKPTLSPQAEKIARRYAATFTRNLPTHLDKRDFLQVALIAAFRAERSYNPAKGATLLTWVRGQVWFYLRQHARDEDHVKRSARKRYGYDLPMELRPPLWLDALITPDEGDTFADSMPDPESAIGRDGVTAGLLCEEVQGWLSVLEPHYRDILVRCYWFDQTQDQIARDLGKSGSRIGQIKRRALALVRERAQL